MPRVLLCSLLGVLASLFLLSPGGAQSTRQPRPIIQYSPTVVIAPNAYWGYTRNTYPLALYGLADLTRAQGDYQVTIQTASLLRERTRQEKLTTRRKQLEHIKWERDFIWAMREEERERALRAEIKRSSDRAPQTEIIAGTVLNTLFKELAKQPPLPASLSRPLRKDLLDNINFTISGGSSCLLRQEELSWPVLLQDDRFATAREAVESNLKQARQDARKGKVSHNTVVELIQLRQQLDDGITQIIRSTSTVWSPRHHIQAMRFTTELQRTLQLMEKPKDAAFLFGQLPTLGTVGELVVYMKENGVTFAPASVGSERYYVAFHAAVAEEWREVEKRKPSEN